MGGGSSARPPCPLDGDGEVSEGSKEGASKVAFGLGEGRDEVDGDVAVGGVVEFPVDGDGLAGGVRVCLEEVVGFAQGVVAGELLFWLGFREAECLAVAREGVVVVGEVLEGGVADLA